MADGGMMGKMADGGMMAKGGKTNKKELDIDTIKQGDKVLAINGEEYYVINLTPQINKLINYYLLEMRNLMDTCFPIIVEK
jgi:hypothetical protein